MLDINWNRANQLEIYSIVRNCFDCTSIELSVQWFVPQQNSYTFNYNVVSIVVHVDLTKVC